MNLYRGHGVASALLCLSVFAGRKNQFSVSQFAGAFRFTLWEAKTWNGPYASLYLIGGSYPTTNGPQQIYVVNENVTKILGTHILKAGVYFAHQQFSQLTQGVENSTIITGDYSGSYNTGNSFADLLTGQIAGYAQSTSNFVANLREKPTDFFVEDQWKAMPRFTANYGLRVNHIGSWYETGGRIAVFDPALYNPGGTYAEAPGMVTHATTPGISISGSRPQGFQFAPSGGSHGIFGALEIRSFVEASPPTITLTQELMHFLR